MSPHETVDDANNGLSRRRMLKTAGLAAGAAWVVPSVLTLSASPAMASPAGCLLCNDPAAIPINGAGSSLTGWTTVAPAAGWITTGTVFQATGGIGLLNRRDRPIVEFSAACIARFAVAPPTQPQAVLTLSGRLRGNACNVNPSTFQAIFYSAPAGGGSVLGTVQLASTGAALPLTATTAVGNIPVGAQSMRIRLNLFGSLFGANPGQARDLTVSVTTC